MNNLNNGVQLQKRRNLDNSKCTVLKPILLKRKHTQQNKCDQQTSKTH